METKLFLRNLILSFVFVFLTSCNFLSELSDKNTDEAILFDVNNLINKGSYSAAITRWNELSSTKKTDRDAKVLLASAYAARGGLDVIQISQSLSNNTGGGATSFFKLLMQAFKGRVVTDYNDIVSAQTTIFSIGASAAARTTDENIFMLFVQMAKLGALFATLADTDANGVVDGGFTTCNIAAISNAYSNQIIAALGNIIEILAVTGTTIGGGTLDDIDTACTTLSALSGIANICSITDPTSGSITATHRIYARTLMAESLAGIGLAINPNIYELNILKLCPD